MKNKFEKIFEQLADFHMLDGYDGWMIGACVYAQREAAGERVSGTEFGCGNDLTENQNSKFLQVRDCEGNCKLCGYAKSDGRGWNRVSTGVACSETGGAGGSY